MVKESLDPKQISRAVKSLQDYSKSKQDSSKNSLLGDSESKSI